QQAEAGLGGVDLVVPETGIVARADRGEVGVGELPGPGRARGRQHLVAEALDQQALREALRFGLAAEHRLHHRPQPGPDRAHHQRRQAQVAHGQCAGLADRVPRWRRVAVAEHPEVVADAGHLRHQRRVARAQAFEGAVRDHRVERGVGVHAPAAGEDRGQALAEAVVAAGAHAQQVEAARGEAFGIVGARGRREHARRGQPGLAEADRHAVDAREAVPGQIAVQRGGEPRIAPVGDERPPLQPRLPFAARARTRGAAGGVELAPVVVDAAQRHGHALPRRVCAVPPPATSPVAGIGRAPRLHYSGGRGDRPTHMEDAVRLKDVMPRPRSRRRKDSRLPDIRAVRDAELRTILGPALRRDPQSAEARGLALSGGGSRSATFGLGVLQALARNGLLECFHYLSTVSGGGYVGAFLQALVRRHGFRRAFATLGASDDAGPARAQDAPADTRPLRHLREYSNYLAPRKSPFSGDTLGMVGTYVRNVLLVQVQLCALILALCLLPLLVYAGADVLTRRWPVVPLVA